MSNRQVPLRTGFGVGPGAGIGAGMGLVFGLLLDVEPSMGLVFGAGIGVMLGLAIEGIVGGTVSGDRGQVAADAHPHVRRIALTLVVLVVAIGASVAVALANGAYFAFVNGYVHATDEIARGLLFSSWLLLIGVPIVAFRPAAFGLAAGDARRKWRLVLGMVAGGAALTALLLLLVGPVPYSQASPFIEIVDVPLTEELVFRGVLLTAIVAALRRSQLTAGVTTAAVVIDGLAFGTAHIANALSLELSFVLAQATFAAVLGMACSYLAVRTRSIFPAILLHAAVNAVVVAF